jgi:hypothetical protein
MQNVEPTDFPCVSDHRSPVSADINRLAAIAPEPLLPGENKPTTLRLRFGLSKALSRGTRLKNF